MNPCNTPTLAEVALLGVLEDQIQRNLEAIRTGQMFRWQHDSYESWLRERFNFEVPEAGQ